MLGLYKVHQKTGQKKRLRSIYATSSKPSFSMSFLKLYAHRPIILKRTLFVKDGPLLLRAQLSRLIEPIRAFLKYLKDIGRDIHIVGVVEIGRLGGAHPTN